MKKALVLNIGQNEIRSITALKELGYYVVATGNKPDLPGKSLIDKYVQADYSDKESILGIASDNSVDAVISNAHDFGVLTAAYVAEKLGLPGHDTYNNAVTLHHKDAFKQFALKHNIQVPYTICFSSEKEAVDCIHTLTYPVIIKPVDLTSGMGVSKAEDVNDANNIVKRAFEASKCKRIVIEEYITGTQQAFSAFLVNGKVAVYCTNDEYSFANPYRVEIDTFPANNSERFLSYFTAEIERIAAILNLEDGIFHLQYIVKDGKPYIIEVMRRIIGNLYGIPAERLTGVNYEFWQTKAQCGHNCGAIIESHTPSSGFFAYRAYMSNKNGIYVGIKFPEEYNNYVFGKVRMMNPGERISDYRNAQTEIVFFEFDTRSQMEDILINRYNESYVKTTGEV